jgi:hypothetical protein
MEENESNKNRKNITIKSALESDKNYIDTIAIQLSCNASDALSHIINLAKSAGRPVESSEETKKQLVNLESRYSQLFADNTRLSAENETLKNNKPEVTEKIVEKEKIVTVEKPLTDYQFICDLGETLSKEARTIRPFIRKFDFKNFNSFDVVENETPEIFISRLTKFSVQRLIKQFKAEYL